jgi:hypothetical protein
MRPCAAATQAARVVLPGERGPDGQGLQGASRQELFTLRTSRDGQGGEVHLVLAAGARPGRGGVGRRHLLACRTMSIGGFRLVAATASAVRCGPRRLFPSVCEQGLPRQPRNCATAQIRAEQRTQHQGNRQPDAYHSSWAPQRPRGKGDHHFNSYYRHIGGNESRRYRRDLVARRPECINSRWGPDRRPLAGCPASWPGGPGNGRAA